MPRVLSLSWSLAAITVAFVLAAAPATHADKLIRWSNLLPQAKPLQDPFNTLTQDQRFDIETIIWARSLTDEERALEHNRLPVEDAKKYERQFRDAGLNVEKLIKDQDAFLKEVARRQKLVNNALDGADVKLAGYLLPLEFTETGDKNFLLVPYVGACVHVPPPPANQIVLVRLAKKMVVRDLFTPVWITGRMKTKISSQSLFLVDGTRDVTVGYHIDGASAELYTD